MTRRRIRVLAGRLDSGAGSHVYHRELVQRLADRGHAVSVVCFESVPEMPRDAEVVEIPRSRRPSYPVVWRCQSAIEYLHCSRALRAAPLTPCDVVIGGEHLFLKAHRRKFPRVPLIYLPHALVAQREIDSYRLPRGMHLVSSAVYSHLQRWALRHADRTLRFTTEACRALETQYGPAVKPRFVVNPMPVAIPAIHIPKDRTGPINLLWVGQLIPRKRIDLALASLSRLRHLDWRFDIVGAGESRADLEQFVRGASLGDRVHFHGFQPNPERWYRTAELLLFPSWLENSPVAMLEAMSHGVPCLAMRGDGVRYHNANAEILAANVDGFLADSDEDFHVHLDALLRDRDRLHHAGEAARRAIRDRHTWTRHLDRYEALFDELASEAPSSHRIVKAVHGTV